MEIIKKGKSLATFNRKRKIFYIALIALPVLQFCIFYLGVHINSILLAFKSYTLTDGQSGLYSYVFTGFENFEQVFHNFATESYLVNAIWNSVFGVSCRMDRLLRQPTVFLLHNEKVAVRKAVSVISVSSVDHIGDCCRIVVQIFYGKQHSRLY